jgi:hypothetical protein
LFGGALLAAGIAGQAEASGFDWNYTSYTMRQYGYVYAFGIGSFSHDYAHPGGPYTTQPYTTFATTEISSTRLLAEYDTAIYAAGAIAYGYFTVASLCDVTVEWDFTETFSDSVEVRLRNVTDGIDLIHETANTAGAQMFELSPGTLYYGLVDPGSGAYEDVAHAMMTIPMPGVGVTLGVFGLGALRRRR